METDLFEIIIATNHAEDVSSEKFLVTGIFAYYNLKKVPLQSKTKQKQKLHYDEMHLYNG